MQLLVPMVATKQERQPENQRTPTPELAKDKCPFTAVLFQHQQDASTADLRNLRGRVYLRQ